MRLKSTLLAGLSAVALMSIAAPVVAQQAGQGAVPAASASTESLMPVEEFRLENGLKVVFHIDRSDPVVAVVLAAHVGSASELPGRTGFAHLFEHLFFLNSENLGPGGLDAMSARIGGSGANGSTSRDITDYLQTVPNDALEKMIWAEADKLGYFINTVTDPVLAKEKQVVKNEKRQSVDTQPYGHTHTVIPGALYPADHPYSWSVIGSLADLDAATLEDVRGFYRQHYTPGNATLVVAGDFDTAQARAWVEKYFAEIPAGSPVAEPEPRPAQLSDTISLFHEDQFAQLPELTLVWPTVPRMHPDEQALDVLQELLTDGKESPLTAVLVDEEKLTDEVIAYSDNGRLAGEAYVVVRGFEGVDLDTVRAALDAGFARFERDGVDAEALARIKTMNEANFYGRLGSVLQKASSLARYDLFGGSADAELAALRAVTAEDVMRVYRTYIKDRPHVATSFVPQGQLALALEGSTQAEVVIEPIVQGAEAAVDPAAGQGAQVARTPSSFDRTQEPPSGATPVVEVPAIWDASLPNGLTVMGIQDDEVPLASFEITIDGGRLFDDPERPGAANLLAQLMDKGTADKTPAELENALKSLGATLNIRAEDERFVISGRTLARNFAPTMALVEEVLLEPRWDETELALAKAATTSAIQSQRAVPMLRAARVFDLVTYGEDHILADSALGTEASVAALTMDDLKRYMSTNLAPNIARVRVVGDVDQATVTAALQGLGTRWQAREVEVPEWPRPAAPEASRVVFYDVPGASQSVLMFGYPALTRADPDYYPATMMNYRLGGGGFASRLTQQLREGQGYTYGIRSGFAGGDDFGTFSIASPVRANVTLEAAALTRDIARDFGATFTAEDLDVTQSYMTKSRARSFETAGAKLGLLANIGDYGLPRDYVAREQAVTEAMTVEQIQALASRLIRTDAMTYVVVGDAATQAGRLEALGYGAPVLVNERVEAAEE
ncbi:M16 family metallopeptidase [Brevundimonas lutea]|uniref:M16 family metallopeptidase n=1 Tax=Brevundimonas lutea TaxID=2293980 RepID=UPI000F02563A|nr:pitrilysin family protein [Brevundimonas lutea]